MAALAEFAPEGTVSIGTVRGNIELALPADARASVDAAVRVGRINCDVPLRERTGDRLRLRGVLNGPGGTVTLRTTSGNIEIRTATA